jgi:putative ATP-binding cassette transporter
VASKVPGTDITVPGFIFWMALIYSVAATWIAHLIGRPLIGLEFEQERARRISASRWPACANTPSRSR